MSSTNDEHESVTIFREYLRIPSVHPNVNYDGCVQFLTKIAHDLKLPIKVIELSSKKPVVIITLVGLEPKLPSILLSSHMDVVPAFLEEWTYNPFEAIKDEEGNIYARGSQDMKCVGIQYIETVRRYLKEGLKLKRTLHLAFIPDEEQGMPQNMGVFVQMNEFKSLNVGFSLDEGIASPTDEFLVFNAERVSTKLTIICPGNTGHGSLFHKNTAAEKIQYVINKFLDLREAEKVKLRTNSELMPGDVTSINLTILSGGKQINMLPPELRAIFDVRVAVDVNFEELKARFLKWCVEAGPDVRAEFSNTTDTKPFITQLDSNNPWWVKFKYECDKMGLQIKCGVFNGATNNKYIRKVGIPALGFSPINNTPVLLHHHNEFLNENVFLKGIDIYYGIIQGLASV